MVFNDVVPWGDAGNGCVHDDEAVDFVWVECGVGVGYHVADVVRDDGGIVETESGDDGANVGGLSFLVVASGGAGGAADAAEVGHDDSVSFDELGGERGPGVACLCVAVDEDDDRACACGANEDVGTGGAMNHLRFEGEREGWLCGCSPGASHDQDDGDQSDEYAGIASHAALLRRLLISYQYTSIGMNKSIQV